MTLHTLATEDSMADHRRFLLGLNPHEGQLYAHHVGQYPVPPQDVQEAEIMEVLSTYAHAQASGADAVVANAAWWMLEIMDPGRKMNRAQANRRTDELCSFGFSVINSLVNKGMLQWTDKAVISPQTQAAMDSLRISQKLTPEEDAVLERIKREMEAEHE